MPRTVQTSETIYKYSELSDEAKYKVISDIVELDYFSFNRDGSSLAEDELINIGNAILKDSIFSHAEATIAWADFSYSQGSGAVLGFIYDSDNFFLDFPNMGEELIEKFRAYDKDNQYELEAEDYEEINKLFRGDLSQILEIRFEVTHKTNYANWDLDWDVYCSVQNLRYIIEDLVSDWIHETFWEKRDLIDNIESEFSSAGYRWYEGLSDINNYNDEYFDGQYFYQNGKFAYYEDELD